MVYSNINMLAAVLFLVPIFYINAGKGWQSAVISVASVSLFAASGIFNIVVFFISMTISAIYFRIATERAASSIRLAIFLLLLMIILTLCKYRDFFMAGSWINSYFDSAGIAIPLGISFYTFHLMGAMIDLRGRNLPYGWSNLFLFGIFFPQLVAGPIVRYNQMAPQFEHGKQLRAANIAAGSHIFLLGLIKKCFIADPVSRLVDPIFSTPGSHPSFIVAAAVLGFYVQVFADFSGYTDMALGLARLLGFRLPPNFRAPYLASSPVEFWSRWHMSLSLWVRDYLYIPLATWSARTFRTRRARGLSIFTIIMLVMAVLGLWHGAAWRFIVFGVFHGLLIVVWRLATRGRRPSTMGGLVLSTIIFQTVLLTSFIVFRAPDFPTAFTIARDLVWWTGGLDGIAEFGWALTGCLTILAIQMVDINIRCRKIATIFRFLRQNNVGRSMLAGLIVAVVAVRLTAMADTSLIAGVSLHPPREQFIYFDF